MDKRVRRRKRKNAIMETIDLVKTILLIVLAVIVIAFVFLYIRGKLGETRQGENSKISAFSSLFGTKEETSVQETESSAQVEIETELTEGLNRDQDGRTFYVKAGEIIKDCWLDIGNHLYRLDEEGYAVTGEYEEEAFRYTFSSDGSLTKISYNETFSGQGDSSDTVQRDGLTVFLDSAEKLGRFSSIVYQGNSGSGKLGGTENPQYTKAGSIQIGEDGYIYWLPRLNDPDEIEAQLTNRLFRMKPGSQVRQVAAEDVDGYRVAASEKGGTVIYYYREGNLYRCGSANFQEDNSEIRFLESFDYCLELSADGRLYLKTQSGYPVTVKTDSFPLKGFEYQLSENGEVLSVQPKTEAEREDGCWYVLSDELFGSLRNVIIRENEDGDQEILSGEFPGECRYLYLCEEDGNIYAEYAMSDGTPRIISISKEGDVDLLLEETPGAMDVEIFGFTEDAVIVKTTDRNGNSSFQKLNKNETSPLAAGIDPIPLEQEKEQQEISPIEQLGPGYAGNQSYGPGMDSASYGPGSTGSEGPGESLNNNGSLGPGSSR